MELSIRASPSRLAELRRAARGYPRGVSDEVATTSSLALDEAATNAVLYGSSGDQPIQVVVHVNNDWVEASVLDHGAEPPAGLPADADTDELPAGGRALWLLRRLVDEVRLERVELGTRVTPRRAIGRGPRPLALVTPRLALGDDGGETARAFLDEERFFPILVHHVQPVGLDSAGDRGGRGVHRMGGADRGGSGRPEDSIRTMGQ
jgi:anti-sigma regulatory factor (Ser/Thr protein kinase)